MILSKFILRLTLFLDLKKIYHKKLISTHNLAVFSGTFSSSLLDQNSINKVQNVDNLLSKITKMMNGRCCCCMLTVGFWTLISYNQVMCQNNKTNNNKPSQSGGPPSGSGSAAAYAQANPDYDRDFAESGQTLAIFFLSLPSPLLSLPAAKFTRQNICSHCPIKIGMLNN